ncbi:MAG TPA: sigma-54 dependent transcriptional regulator, partial [Gemmataceae bacterium]|nr:sigma-54 dependent transcriptional regulator [Gemmataceae bacterium]
TRLAFTCEAPTQEADEPSWAEDKKKDAPERAEPVSDPNPTILQADELTALCSFMTSSVEETSPRALVARALSLIHRQTWATLVGFLSLDAEQPLPQMVVPDQADVDASLSRQLTQAVQKSGRLVWLAVRPLDEDQSESLASLTDAVCVPLRASDTELGALHVYKDKRTFTEREVLFIEVLAGFLAKSLYVLRGHRNLVAENVRLRGRSKPHVEGMVGNSPALGQVRQQVEKVGPLDCTVLITGESGVGKELVALEMHRKSKRSDGPLVIVHCGAISPNLLESELFGHVKGAFTGADRNKPGYFQQADYGTLFLDEIGEMSPECQVKLLRVLERKPIRPVGGTEDVHVDVRIVAATHRDLDKMVREEKFRHDLFYRLEVPINVPPLRERMDDIPALAEHFLVLLGREYRKSLKLTASALSRLKSYSWPGNIRQLRAVLGAAAAMTDDGLIDAEDLRLPAAPADQDSDSSLKLERIEARAIREALRRCGGAIGTAADVLGIHRDTLTAKMKKYDISKSGE